MVTDAEADRNERRKPPEAHTTNASPQTRVVYTTLDNFDENPFSMFKSSSLHPISYSQFKMLIKRSCDAKLWLCSSFQVEDRAQHKAMHYLCAAGIRREKEFTSCDVLKNFGGSYSAGRTPCHPIEVCCEFLFTVTRA